MNNDPIWHDNYKSNDLDIEPVQSSNTSDTAQPVRDACCETGVLPDTAQLGSGPTYQKFRAEICEKVRAVINGVNGVVRSGCGDLMIERSHDGSIILSPKAAQLLLDAALASRQGGEKENK